MALNELTIVLYKLYAVPRSLCKDTKGVMEEIRVKQYRIRDIFNFLFIPLVPSLSIYSGP